eukprot:8640601-Pyramimonas_sp.AAC.1
MVFGMSLGLISSRLGLWTTMYVYISLAPLRPHPPKVVVARARGAQDHAYSVTGQWPPQAFRDSPWPIDSLQMRGRVLSDSARSVHMSGALSGVSEASALVSFGMRLNDFIPPGSSALSPLLLPAPAAV